MKLGYLVAGLVCAIASAVVPAYAEGNVAFAYQGRVRVQGEPFAGTGQFKFAIVNTSATATLWSNDGTSQDAGEPSGFLPLTVEDGIFNVIIGDSSAGMQPINGTIFNSPTPLKLRVWFNDGVRGFQQLNPDHNLVNLTLNVLETGHQDFTIYVNGATGDDGNNGLTADTAKKTIQAAIDTLPDRIRCNVTVDVADGIYREEVLIHGITAAPGKAVTIVGDESWTTASAGTPSVVISAADASNIHTREHALFATQCTGIVLRGLHFQYAKMTGARLENGAYKVYNCLATDTGVSSSVTGMSGFLVTRGGDAYLYDCTSRDNQGASGFYVSVSSRAVLTGCVGSDNLADGLFVQAQCSCDLMGTGVFSGNFNGIRVWSSSYVGCGMPLYLTLTDNTNRCLEMQYESQMMAWYYNKNLGHYTITGNGNSNQENVVTGSDIWW